MVSTAYVDDFDGSIHWNGSWQANREDTYSFMNTVHLSRNVGDSATFSFNGTSVVVYGQYGPARAPNLIPVSNYTVDSGNPTTFKAPNITSQLYQQIFFSQGLEDGPHVLEIKFVSGDWLWLDFLSFTPSVTAAASSTTGTIMPSSVARSTHDSHHTPALIGGVLGGMAFILLLTLLFFLRRQKYRRHTIVKEPEDYTIVPFTAAPSASTETKWGVFQRGQSDYDPLADIIQVSRETPPSYAWQNGLFSST